MILEMTVKELLMIFPVNENAENPGAIIIFFIADICIPLPKKLE